MVAALLTALLCWACTDDTAESADARPVLTIAAAEETWQSQTVTITRSGETLETLKEVGFGIFSTSLGLSNQQVQWKDDDWNYGSKLLWPNNEAPADVSDLDIYAYAPYHSSISRTDDKITFNPILRNTIDLLWAERKSITPSGTLTLNFKHALGMLSFGHITNSYGRNITLKKIKLSGTRFINRQLSLETGTWSGTATEVISEENDLLDLPVADNASESIPMPAILQIPGQAVTIEFIFKSADYGTEVITKDITFEQGVNKTVNLTIKMNHEVVVL